MDYFISDMFDAWDGAWIHPVDAVCLEPSLIWFLEHDFVPTHLVPPNFLDREPFCRNLDEGAGRTTSFDFFRFFSCIFIEFLGCGSVMNRFSVLLFCFCIFIEFLSCYSVITYFSVVFTEVLFFLISFGEFSYLV